jgi:folate-binding protein YgfZ
MVARLDWFGRPGMLILHDVQARRLIADRLAAAGCVPGSPDLLESLRIEGCFPYSGVDVTEDHLAPEVGRPWAISYTKGCYLGQEPIARIDALGHVNKLLRGVRLEAGPVPEPGAAVIADGKEIGNVTSAATSLEDGRPIALAWLRSKFSEPGTTVFVRTDRGDVSARVFGPTPYQPEAPARE